MALLEHVRGRPRRRRHEPKEVVVQTAPGGPDRHVHCALFDENGCGQTSPGPDGHVHRVQDGRVMPGVDHLGTFSSHAHDFGAVRCELAHDQELRHR